MPVCGYMKRDGTPCQRRVAECWQHRGPRWQVRLAKSLRGALITVLLGIIATAVYENRGSLVQIFQNNEPPITKPMPEALRDRSGMRGMQMEERDTRDTVNVEVHRNQNAPEPPTNLKAVVN